MIQHFKVLQLVKSDREKGRAEREAVGVEKDRDRDVKEFMN